LAKKATLKKEWWTEGVKFECQGSGKCCTSHGEYGYVYFSKEDRVRAAKFLGITEKQFRDQYCRQIDKLWALKDPPDNSPDCLFLKDKRCTIYEGRPTQCRTWPFWPSVMNAKTWNKSVASFCPGVGKGRTWTAEEIANNLAQEEANDASLMKEYLQNK
jgi:Fe-S-cluster containining protein